MVEVVGIVDCAYDNHQSCLLATGARVKNIVCIIIYAALTVSRLVLTNSNPKLCPVIDAIRPTTNVPDDPIDNGSEPDMKKSCH